MELFKIWRLSKNRMLGISYWNILSTNLNRKFGEKKNWKETSNGPRLGTCPRVGWWRVSSWNKTFPNIWIDNSKEMKRLNSIYFLVYWCHRKQRKAKTRPVPLHEKCSQFVKTEAKGASKCEQLDSIRSPQYYQQGATRTNDRHL